MNELNEYSNEYRKVIDYICYTLNRHKVKNILVKEKSPHFVFGFLKRFFYTDIAIFVDVEKSGGVVTKDREKNIKTYNKEKVDAVIFPFSLETEDDWSDKLSNSLMEKKSEFVVLAFRNPFSYKLLLGRGTKEALNPFKVRAILKKQGYQVLEEKGGLHLKYILYSFFATMSTRLGNSSGYFRFSDKAVNEYLTDNGFLRNLSYIRIIVARRGPDE
jgi:hypothetical protein